MNNSTTLQQAAKDLALIRRAIERTSRPGQSTSSQQRTVLDANLFLQGLALAIALALGIFELATDNVISVVLRLSPQDPSLTLFGIANIGLALLFLVVCAYFVVWRSAKHAEQPLTIYLTNNFVYLHRLSFIGDLVVKFAVVTLIILSGKPQWFAPLLTLFIGDYLIQGRFFTISLRPALLLGLACFAAAGIQVFTHHDELLWPLAIAVVISALGIMGTIRTRRALAATSSSGS